MIYDGDGNRVGKSVNGVSTYYLVDDLNPTGYPQVVEELNAAGAVQRQYTYGLQRISQNQFMNGAWTPSFYGYDGGGNVRYLENVAGAVTDTYEYDSYGNEVYRYGSTPNNYMYRAEAFDSDLDLYYLRARYYNPVSGRFMSRDPEEGKAKDPKTLHKYLYAGGDPVNGIDRSGREEAEEEAGFWTEDRKAFATALLCSAGLHWYAWDLLKGADADDIAVSGALGILGCLTVAWSY
jgi:RHS repeat-associated protein